MSLKRIIFGLGSNLGDRQKNLQQATELLISELNLKNHKISNPLENPALLLPNSPESWNINFLNIAVSGDIILDNFSPEKILEICKKIEVQLGRKDRERWAPREIDVDILAIETLKIEIDQKLTIPHSGLLQRDFFLKTVAEIEPELLKKLQAIHS